MPVNETLSNLDEEHINENHVVNISMVKNKIKNAHENFRQALY